MEHSSHNIYTRYGALNVKKDFFLVVDFVTLFGYNATISFYEGLIRVVKMNKPRRTRSHGEYR